MRWASFVAGIAATIAVILIVSLVVVLAGGYNIAATDRHSPLVAWALHTNFENSVKSHAGDIAPPQFSAAMIDAGAPEYKAMCARCHGGVGESREDWAEGMLPKPPALARAADEWSHAEIFWLVKHGAKMTAMPAFGDSHDDQTIWNIAAFVKALPTMSAAQYAAYSTEHGEEKERGEAHAHAEAPSPQAD
ncbi:c-type cytochrome [Croceibacterium aestuarii]|uniref:c-type cytochrome n=1 Tax=Croceibacterium aestuarii TaxID=3064139 RepID=UPI00272EDC81|nr:cytochrome c [Croceibacterium sp. D39]